MNVIKDQLGHSSISVTMDRYAHLLPSACQEAADQLEKAVFDNPLDDNLLTIKAGE
jgi:integrase